jgi:hypothetical protein
MEDPGRSSGEVRVAVAIVMRMVTVTVMVTSGGGGVTRRPLLLTHQCH